MNLYNNSASQAYFAFNIWSIESAQAILEVAADGGHDVILQTSEKVFERIDNETLRAFVTNYTYKRKIHGYLHLDHCRRIDCIQRAIRCGWDSVMLDASDKSLEENIRLTNEVCAMAKARGIYVEAEIGQIRGVEDDIAAIEDGVAKIEDVEQFLCNTKVDMLAVAIGTSHGVYCREPRLHYELIEEINQITDTPLVIHGGTGLSDDILLRLLSCQNVGKINISTDLKQAYRRGLEDSIQKGYLERAGFDPLKVSEAVHNSLKVVAADKLRLLRERA